MTPGPSQDRSRDVSGSRRRPMCSPLWAEPASGSRACSMRSPGRRSATPRRAARRRRTRSHGSRDRAAPTWAVSWDGSGSPIRRFAITRRKRSETWRSSTCRTSIPSRKTIDSASRRSCPEWMPSSGSPIRRSTTTRSFTTISSRPGCLGWNARSSCSTRPTESRLTTPPGSGATSNVIWRRWHEAGLAPSGCRSC